MILIFKCKERYDINCSTQVKDAKGILLKLFAVLINIIYLRHVILKNVT